MTGPKPPNKPDAGPTSLQQIYATATVEVRDAAGNLVETITTTTPITAAQARALQGDQS